MKLRIGLVLLQAIGALSILPYPAVLVANVMSIAGEGPRGLQRLVMALPYLLLSLYPLVWIALYTFSWRLIGRGSTLAAFALSAIPAAATLAGIAYLTSSDAPPVKSRAAAVAPANPLIRTISCAGPRKPAGEPEVSLAAALNDIQESNRVNDAAPGYGTPLVTALLNLSYDFAGNPADGRQEGFERLVCTLLARGAQLSTEESLSMDNVWRLKRATFYGPIGSRIENPLVWRILQTADPRGPYIRNGEKFQLRAQDLPWLNRSTRLHGTPLYTGLRLGPKRLVAQLIAAGAQLSPEEINEPAAAARLRQFESYH